MIRSTLAASTEHTMGRVRRRNPEGGDEQRRGRPGLRSAIQGVGQGRQSGELVQRDGAKGWGSGSEKGFNPAYGFGRQQNVPANVAYLGGNVIDHDDLAAVFHGMDDRSRFIRAWASCNRAFQGWLLLSRGVRHFGGRGSYAVIKISIGCAVVQTMWSGRPLSVSPCTKQHAPRRCSG